MFLGALEPGRFRPRPASKCFSTDSILWFALDFNLEVHAILAPNSPDFNHPLPHLLRWKSSADLYRFYLVPHLPLRKNPYLLQGDKSKQAENKAHRWQRQTFVNRKGQAASSAERPNLHVKCDRYRLFAKTRYDRTCVA